MTIGVFEADEVAAAVDYVPEHWPGQRLILYGQSMGRPSCGRSRPTPSSSSARSTGC